MTTHHHHPEHDPETSLRFRLYIGGKVQAEQWIDATDPDAGDVAEVTSMFHADACRAADSEGFPWVIEVYDPTADPEVAYLRFGTDIGKLDEPHPVSLIWHGGGGVSLGPGTYIDHHPDPWADLGPETEPGAITDARATRDHMRNWARGTETHRGES